MNIDNLFILPGLTRIQFNLSLIGICFYLFIILLFNFYYNCISFIKEEIFSFILLKSLSSLIEIFIESNLNRTIFLYFSHIILFTLLLIQINKNLTQKKIVEDIEGLAINDKLYIILIFMLIFFPFEYFFNLQIFELFVHNIVKIVTTFLLFKHIDKKIKTMIEHIKEEHLKNQKNKNDINFMLNNDKLNYYLKMIKTIDSMILTGFILYVIFFSVNIWLLYNYNEILKYINDIINGCAIFSISLAQLLFFYCSNKIELENGEKKTKLNETIKNFVIINIFNQDDTD